MGGLITAEKRKLFLQLDETLRDCTKEIAEADASGNQMLKTLAVAEATEALRKQLTEPMMASVMSLMGSPLGFKTDRDNSNDRPNYTAMQVRDPLIVAMLRGFRPVGNEMNIIAGNFYATKEGMKRVLRDFEGLTDLKLKAGVPKMMDGGALVEYSATWKLNGQADSLHCSAPSETDKSDTRIPVRVNKMMGTDAIRGKAESKILKLIYEQLTGSAQGVADDIDDAINGEVVGSEMHDEPAGENVVDEQPENESQDDELSLAQLIGETIDSIKSCTEPELIDRISKTAIAAVKERGGNSDLIASARQVRLDELKPKGKSKQQTLA